MALLFEIFWIALIALCIIAAIVMAVLENSRRKAAYAGRSTAVSPPVESTAVESMDNLDDFGSMPVEPDFDFPKS